MRRSPRASTRHFCLVSSSKPSVGQPTGRGEGVSSRTTSALKLGDQFQRSSKRITWTCVSPPWKILCAQPLRSMGKYSKRYPSTPQRMTSRGSHQSSLAQQVRWEQRQWSYEIGSFALVAHLRS